MRTNVERLDKTLVEIEVGLDPAEVDQALGQAYRKVVKKVKIPGFRPGTAPRPILEAHYGKEVLYDEALEILVPRAYQDALHENGLEPIEEPEMTVVEPLVQGRDFVFKAKVQVLPTVELGVYQGLQVPKPEAKVEEGAVEKRLQEMREQYAELAPSAHEQVEMGDFAILDFDGFIDDKPFPGGSAKGYTLEAGGEGFVPGFSEGVIGMRPGETREIKVNFPADYHAENLAGKEARFRLTLHEIKTKEVPEIDEEFAKSLGHDSVEALTESVRSALQAQAEREADEVFAQRVVKEAVEASRVEVPEILVDRAVARNYDRLMRNLGYQGITGDKYLARIGKTEEEIRAELREPSAKEVREELVMNAIRKAEGIEPTEEEITEKLRELAAIYRAKDFGHFLREMERTGRLGLLIDGLAREKTVKFLVEKAEALPERGRKKG